MRIENLAKLKSAYTIKTNGGQVRIAVWLDEVMASLATLSAQGDAVGQPITATKIGTSYPAISDIRYKVTSDTREMETHTEFEKLAKQWAALWADPLHAYDCTKEWEALISYVDSRAAIATSAA